MANEEHLKILMQGVGAWNQWRKENPEIVPDLSGADLRKTDIREANLRKADLRKADLSGANLSLADLFVADLSSADLSQAHLYGAHLNGAKLRKADLNRAFLSEASLHGANLSRAHLNGAFLKKADLNRAHLSGADLRGANLYGADLNGAHFSGADLSVADLRNCNLVYCKLTSASLTGVNLYGTSRDDWVIKDVKCDYVYWDFYSKIKTPRDRLFKPGEFESLYKVLPTIEYVFGDGMTPIDPLIMDHVVEKIRQKIPEFDIKIDSINARGLAPSIKFTVKHQEQKEKALAMVEAEYKTKLKLIEAERDRYWAAISKSLDEPKYKLLNASPGSIVATDGSTINVQHTVYNYHIGELRKAIEKAPKKSFTKIAKDKALDIVQGALDDIAKDAVKDAAKKIVVLGTMLAPTIIEQIPHVFEIFKNMGQ